MGDLFSTYSKRIKLINFLDKLWVHIQRISNNLITGKQRVNSLEELLKLSKKKLKLALEMKELMQENPQNKKRMYEVLLKQCELTQQTLKLMK